MTPAKPIIAAALVCIPGLATATGPDASTLIADLRPEMPTQISGTVETIISYDEFVLVDGSGSAHVYIGANPMPVSVGQRVSVEGYLDDGIAPEFYAAAIVTASGETIPLPRGY